MAGKHLTEEEINKFLKASEDLMNLGISFSHGIDVAFSEFQHTFELMMKSNYVEKAVAEMLSASFTRLAGKVKSNLQNIDSIYTEGGQWYSYYLGRSVGKIVNPPPAADLAKAKAQLGS